MMIRIQSRHEEASDDTGRNVLVVDDEYIMTRKLFRQYFRRKNELNLKFYFAENGERALAQIDERLFDVIVTDIRMPEMDGIQLLRCLKDRGKKIVPILMTAYDVEDYSKEAMELGVLKIFQKPISFPLLTVAIREGLVQFDRLNDD